MTARDTLGAECAGIREKLGDKSIVFVSGNFNVVHPGHVRLLRFASERGEALVIGVNPDGGEHVHVPADLRLEGLRALEFVDHAMILPCSPEEMISALKPAVVVKGKEHEQSRNPESAAVDSYGGKLLFGSHDHRFSSIDLIRRELQESGPPAIVKPTDFLERHRFTPQDLKSIMTRFSGMRVAVVGDLIVDEYIDCEPLGMSQEDPTLVVSPIHEARFLGGAAIVAAHARGLGAEARLFSVGGCDEAADYAREQLDGYGVRADILEDDSRPTTLKQRYRAEGKTLLRVSRLRQHDIAEDLCERLVKVVRAAAASSDLLIFSDFNYGCLPTAVVDAVMETAIAKQGSCRRGQSELLPDGRRVALQAHAPARPDGTRSATRHARLFFGAGRAGGIPANRGRREQRAREARWRGRPGASRRGRARWAGHGSHPGDESGAARSGRRGRFDADVRVDGHGRWRRPLAGRLSELRRRGLSGRPRRQYAALDEGDRDRA